MTHTHPLPVSVIIPVYNRRDLIAATLDSVFAQTYTNFHLYVCDDASTDGSLDILRHYARSHADTMTLLESDRNQGAPATVNRLLDVVDGDLVAYLDSDDLWLPQKLEKQVAYMRAHPEVVYSFHDVDYIDGETGKRLGTVSEIVGRGRGKLRGGDVRAALDPRLAMSSPSVMVRRDAIGSTRRDIRFRVSEDLLWDVDILAKGGRLGAINEVLAVYRRHASSLSRSDYWTQAGTEEMLMLLSAVEARYPHLAVATKPYRRMTLMTAISAHIRGGDYREARTIAVNALRFGLGPRPLLVFLAYRALYARLSWVNRESGMARRIGRLVYR